MQFARGQRFERRSPRNQGHRAMELSNHGWLRKYKEQSAEPEVDLCFKMCTEIDHPQVDCRDIVWTYCGFIDALFGHVLL